MIYGLNRIADTKQNVSFFGIPEYKLDIDTREMCIDMVHRLVQLTDTKYRGRMDYKRPMVV